MKKILFLALVSLLLFATLTVVGSAASPEGSETTVGEVTPETETEVETETDTDAVTESNTPLVVAAVADFITQNADTILGILTLVGSLLVAFFYKMGLLPMVRSGLSALKEMLGKSSEVTEAFTRDAGDTFTRIEEQTKPVLAIAARSEELLSQMETRLSALETALRASEKDRRDTAAVLRTETELFYELLHSVNLPEAQKESMTESYYRLKRQLEADA